MPTRAATTSPVPSTRVTDSTKVDRQPSLAPVPWVPVAIAPEIVCVSMSPRLGRASPCWASVAFSVARDMPAWTVTRLLTGSTSMSSASPSSRSRRPSVPAAAVNECPAPTGLTVRPSTLACLTSAATSAVEPGRATVAESVWLPAQLAQAVAVM
jgi:hypothetical protein